jgi:ketosteroid isomerase-like protein
VSQENVELARERYEALSSAVQNGDFDGFLTEYAHPEVEWVPLQESLDSVAVQRGREAVSKRFTDMVEDVDEPRIEAEEFIDAGDRTVVGVRMSGRGKASGAEVEGRLFHVVDTDADGRLTRIEWYASRDEALKAVGLEE